MEENPNITEYTFNGTCRRRAATNASLNISRKHASNLKRVTSLLRKRRAKKLLTEEEKAFLVTNSEHVKEFYKRREKRVEWLKRQNEHEDSPKDLKEKCFKLAQAIHDAEFLVVYTGAGISTAASIPDYRGPNGIWTRLQKGKDIGTHDLTAAEPTFTHMALSCLHSKGIVRHVVSQNCDGLHLRSGLPKTSLSEVHGNMYIEVCKHCVPAREYVRTFDVTEKTSTFKHTTGRRCYRCGEPLVDTIVHFGERGRLRWPLNWQGACQAAKACDTILCLGSSLKVLRKYPWLWQMNRPHKKRPHLYVVNLQWTPKDKDATVKINGKCDDVMRLVMDRLGFEVPPYVKGKDPIFQISTPLHTDEFVTIHRPLIEPPSSIHSNLSRQKSRLHKSSNQALFTTSLMEKEICEKRLDLLPNSLLNSGLGEILETLNPVLNCSSFHNAFHFQDKISKVESCDFSRELDFKPDVKAVVKIEESIKTEPVSDGCFTLELNIKKEEFADTKDEIKQELKEEKDELKEENTIKEESVKTPHSSDDCNVNLDLSEIHLLNSLPEKEQSTMKPMDFYGTGLCIRSSEPSEQTSNDEDDCDDTSVSSIHSENKDESSEEIRKTNGQIVECEANLDFMLISSDSCDMKMNSEHPCENGDYNLLRSLRKDPHSVSSPHEEDTRPPSSFQHLEHQEELQWNKENGLRDETEKYCCPNILNEDCKESEHLGIFSDQKELEFDLGKDRNKTFITREVSNESNTEIPFNVLFTDSDFMEYKTEGSYLLHTKVIDGVIHAAEVKALSNYQEKINGLTNRNAKTSPVKEPHSELKDLWCQKICGSLSTDQTRPKTKPTLLELDDDVKRLWFWGFDTRPKPEEPKRRLTRSSYQKSLLLSKNNPRELPDCHCEGANPELCRRSVLRTEVSPLEEEMIRARESVRKRRQHNYRRFEPVFEIALKSFIYERRKMRRRSRREEEDDEEEEEKEVDEEIESVEEVKKNGELKVVPGWYGKGYRKIIKKKRRTNVEVL